MFHYKRGSLFNQENLVWSHDAVRNFCDKDLQAIIDAKMLKYKASERFGPLYYYELVQQMTDVDSKAVRAITSELTSLKISDLEGQSIANVASTIRSTLIWLSMVNMIPPDIDAIVYDVLETCTVPNFQLYLKTLVTNASLMNIRISHDMLLEKAEAHYRTLIISKKWDASGPHGSVFQAQQLRRTTNPAPRGAGAPSASDRPRFTLPSWNRTAPIEPHERDGSSMTGGISPMNTFLTTDEADLIPTQHRIQPPWSLLPSISLLPMSIQPTHHHHPRLVAPICSTEASESSAECSTIFYLRLPATESDVTALTPLRRLSTTRLSDPHAHCTSFHMSSSARSSSSFSQVSSR
jgi:hypothetical protein